MTLKIKCRGPKLHFKNSVHIWCLFY
jgi:hypothetical protein